VFSLDPFRVPPTTYAHTHDPEKITSLTSPLFDPMFYRLKAYMPVRHIEMEFPDLRLRYEPYTNFNERTIKMLAFLREVNNGGPLPQLFYMNSRVGDHYGEI
jgi:hypothetical protein